MKRARREALPGENAKTGTCRGTESSSSAYWHPHLTGDPQCLTNRAEVEVLPHSSGQPVEGGLACCGHGRLRPDGAATEPIEEGGAEPVVAEQAVEVGAGHAPLDRDRAVEVAPRSSSGTSPPVERPMWISYPRTPVPDAPDHNPLFATTRPETRRVALTGTNCV